MSQSINREIKFSPVGVVRTSVSDDEVRKRPRSFESIIEIFPSYQDAVEGLEGFSHILVLAHLNKLRPEQVGHLRVKPRALLRYGAKLDQLPLMGVFSLDSPTRPNPIGLSLVPLLRIEGQRNIVVSNLDYFDGTPILDVKPYQASYRAEVYRVPEWHKKLVDAGHG